MATLVHLTCYIIINIYTVHGFCDYNEASDLVTSSSLRESESERDRQHHKVYYSRNTNCVIQTILLKIQPYVPDFPGQF